MTIALALEYIPRRMEELGYGEQYILRFRHLVLKPQEKLEINACNQFFILVEQPADVSVESQAGIYDLSRTNTNEMQYEHQGIITIGNLGGRANHLRFIQVIPRHIKTPQDNGSQH